ncbi:MAG: ATP-binding protein, partial [Actinomycetota bacterium]
MGRQSLSPTLRTERIVVKRSGTKTIVEVPPQSAPTPLASSNGSGNPHARIQTRADELGRLVEKRTDELMQSQTRLRELAIELNLTEQRERKRLAIELHDHLQQLLVLAKLKMGQGKRLTQSTPVVLDLLQQTDEVLSDALTYTRSLVAELSPSVLREHGFVAGMRWLAGWMQRHELQVAVESNQNTLVMPEEQAFLLFQSVRELLINAAKHAKCHQAWVEITEHQGTLCIIVRDNGVGFDGSVAAGVASDFFKFGLLSVHERMNALGGSMNLDTAPGRGTTCVLTLPLLDRDKAPSHTPHSWAESPKQSQTLSQKTGTIGVVLVDDHAMVREGLCAVLEHYPDILLLGEAADGE